MKVVVVLIAVLITASSCTPAWISPSRVSTFGEKERELDAYVEYAKEVRFQELTDREYEQRRQNVSSERRRSGLTPDTRCPRCYRTVSLPRFAKEGDEVRCEHCGKSFVLEHKPHPGENGP
jgi:hypothetical protein